MVNYPAYEKAIPPHIIFFKSSKNFLEAAKNTEFRIQKLNAFSKPIQFINLGNLVISKADSEIAIAFYVV